MTRRSSTMDRDTYSRPLAAASVGSRRPFLPAAATATHLQRRPAVPPDDQPTEDVIPMGEGRFQAMVMVASALAGTAFLLHLISFRVTTRVMDHWCRPPEAFANLSAAEWRSTAIPLEPDGSRSQCTRFEPPDAGSRARVVPCDAWDFDTERYGNNIVSEWRLVCDRRWLVELAVLVYMAACAVFLPLVGVAADRVGRRLVMHVSLAALVAAGFATSLANSYLLFVALRIVVSAASNALFLVLYALLYEVTTPARRDRYCFVAIAVASVAAPLSMLALSGLRLGWESLHLALMAPTSALALAYCSVGNESPVWLVRSWNAREAEAVALRAARINGAPLDECRAWFTREMQRRDSELPLLLFEHSPLAIFAPDVRGSLVLLSYIWAATSFAFNQVLFRLAPQHRRDIAVCVVAICMALAAVATEYLPVAVSSSGRADGAPSGAAPTISVSAYPSRRVSVATADERRRSMLDSLVPLPKGPNKERAHRRPRPSAADDRLPEQYSVRVSGSMSLRSTSLDRSRH
ncbi:solute carrier family 22 member 13 isoform X2 [Dermacentor silvarum]|uniref:solute carrier family 22 member 13 isoform X2 n=1 Tax=Dermacentor silvarum TaxID=543639 RepID=UPI002101664C|nr:solute carrier family 22 member 13 isoform X2 [Dermacentor silvarum]